MLFNLMAQQSVSLPEEEVRHERAETVGATVKRSDLEFLLMAADDPLKKEYGPERKRSKLLGIDMRNFGSRLCGMVPGQAAEATVKDVYRQGCSLLCRNLQLMSAYSRNRKKFDLQEPFQLATIVEGDIMIEDGQNGNATKNVGEEGEQEERKYPPIAKVELVLERTQTKFLEALWDTFKAIREDVGAFMSARNTLLAYDQEIMDFSFLLQNNNKVISVVNVYLSCALGFRAAAETMVDKFLEATGDYGFSGDRFVLSETYGLDCKNYKLCHNNGEARERLRKAARKAVSDHFASGKTEIAIENKILTNEAAALRLVDICSETLERDRKRGKRPRDFIRMACPIDSKQKAIEAFETHLAGYRSLPGVAEGDPALDAMNTEQMQRLEEFFDQKQYLEDDRVKYDKGVSVAIAALKKRDLYAIYSFGLGFDRLSDAYLEYLHHSAKDGFSGNSERNIEELVKAGLAAAVSHEVHDIEIANVPIKGFKKEHYTAGTYMMHSLRLGSTLGPGALMTLAMKHIDRFGSGQAADLDGLKQELEGLIDYAGQFIEHYEELKLPPCYLNYVKHGKARAEIFLNIAQGQLIVDPDRLDQIAKGLDAEFEAEGVDIPGTQNLHSIGAEIYSRFAEINFEDERKVRKLLSRVRAISGNFDPELVLGEEVAEEIPDLEAVMQYYMNNTERFVIEDVPAAADDSIKKSNLMQALRCCFLELNRHDFLALDREKSLLEDSEAAVAEALVRNFQDIFGQINFNFRKKNAEGKHEVVKLPVRGRLESFK